MNFVAEQAVDFNALFGAPELAAPGGWDCDGRQATSFTVNNPNPSNVDFIITGSGFSYTGNNDPPITGVIESITAENDNTNPDTVMWRMTGLAIVVPSTGAIIPALIDLFAGADTLVGSTSDDVLFGFGGTDTFAGGDGADTFQGGGGVDTVNYSLETGAGGIHVTLFDSGTVTDTFGKIDTLGQIEIIRGTFAPDLMTGDNLSNQFFGLGDTDTLGGGGGNDTLWGGAARDTIGGGDGNDTLRGEDGNDLITGGDDNDTAFGGDDADDVRGLAGNDTLRGDAGNDKIDGGPGDDKLFGGADNDTLKDNRVAKIDLAKPESGNVLHGDAGKDTISGVGKLFGDDGADTIKGVGLLDGGEANDRLESGGVENAFVNFRTRLVGGDGKDTLVGSGTPTTFDYSYAGNGIRVFFATATVNVSSSDIDKLVNFEDVTVAGSRFADTMAGSGEDETMRGADGADVLKGSGGVDRIQGNDGLDKLFGDAGDDFLFGDAGNDIIRTGASGPDFETALGGAGNDKIFADGPGKKEIQGQADADTITAGARSEVFCEGGTGVDRFVLERGGKIAIRDFSEATEKIDLRDFDIPDFAALKAFAENDGRNVVVNLVAGSQLTIVSTSVEQLRADDFLF